MRAIYKRFARIGIILISLGGLNELGFGQTLKGVYVFSEQDDEETRQCNLSVASVVASAEAALRFNRVAVSNSKIEEIKLYINNNVMYLSGENRCVFNQSVSFYKNGFIKIDQSGRGLNGDLVLCQRQKVAIFSRPNIQSRANESVRQLIDLCLSEIEKGAR